MFGLDPISIIITVATSLVGMFLSNRLKSKFEYYSKIRLMNGKSGREVAEAMLKHYNITDVQVISVDGFLSDHYNPVNKTVNLSPDVFEGRSIAAAAVAAHECGHAVQHATAYSMLTLRSAIVPVVNFASMGLQFAMAIAFMTINSMPQIMLITIILFAATTVFTLITLPVEFDASNRAKAWLRNSNMAMGEENEGVKDALWWAAMTYVSAAMSSVLMLVYLIFRYMGATRD
ncbi:MAG: zinc metallopeptidase [Saprospiraceae bacterium]